MNGKEYQRIRRLRIYKKKISDSIEIRRIINEIMNKVDGTEIELDYIYDYDVPYMGYLQIEQYRKEEVKFYIITEQLLYLQ